MRMSAALRQRTRLCAERSVDLAADQNERGDQSAEQDELGLEVHRHGIVDDADDRRRGADPDEEGAGRERLDGAERKADDEPGERGEVRRSSAR